MVDTTLIAEHMEVVGSDGEHVGTVDHVLDDTIKLTKSDADSEGQHHTLPVSLVDSVEGKVMLSLTAEQAREQWQPAG